MRTRTLLNAVAILAAGCLAGPMSSAPFISTGQAREKADGGPAPAGRPITPAEARAIAREAYIYGFPLVDSYRIQYSYFVDRGGPEFKAPWNEIHNEARVYTPDDKAVQTPNSDTPYSQLGVDLRAEPMVLTVPAVESGRYYSLQFVDLYTFNFAYVGSRATGNEAGNFLLAGPGWKGEKPEGIKAVIRSETEFAFVLYRTQLFKPDDIANVKTVQAGYRVQPLSGFSGKPAPAAAPMVDFPRPLSPEQQRSSPEFFNILDFVLRFCPTHPSETELRARFARLGIGGGFDATKLPPEIRKAVEEGMADAWREFAEFKKTQLDTGKFTSADGFGTRQFMNGRYIDRMAAAVLGIYGNSKEEAIYPFYLVDSNGERPDASRNRYTLRFGPDGLPPVHAFWSLTLYELPSSLLVANPLNRYLINSPMLPDLKRDADGGLSIDLQHESPGREKESNWLPAPKGPFFAVLRLYWPREDALNGKWKAPALRRVETASTSAVPVTADNFIRAESDLYFGNIVKDGGFGRFLHIRQPTPIDRQTVIRMNRDTLYSAAVFDLAAGPVTLTLPDAGKRFMSMQMIDEDHYVPAVVYGAGKYTFDRERIGTRYIATAVRTLVDPSDPKDLGRVHSLQDAIKVEQKVAGRFEVPAWDPAGQKKVRDALLALGSTLPDSRRMFGPRDQVDPIRHLIGSAMAWGGNPEKDAIYLNVTPSQNDGKTVHRLTVGEVPVDGFWSISVYNAEGYFQPNKENAYTLNNLTARKNEDGSITVQFGGDDGKSPNRLPITPGWNYLVRLYRPRKEILDGTWKFPEAGPVR
jgi:hypothetical protein